MKEEIKRATPAYTTYTAFMNLINDLRENDIPSHITRSVVKGSNSGKAMMMASLKYLGLIAQDETPTDTLAQLVENDKDYNINLKQLLLDKYPFLFGDGIDIKNTTTEKVAEKFQEAGASGSTISKCMAFFLTAAKEAGIQVSPRVKAPKVVRSQRKKKTGNVKDPDGGDESKIPEGMEGMDRITVPFRGIADGIIFFPENLDQDDAKRAIKMTTFILEQYYEIDDDKKGE